MRTVQPIWSHQRQPVTALRQVAAMTAVGVLAACGGHAPNSTGAVPTTTAPVIRTDITSRQQLQGTLGYAGSYTVVNQAGPGVLPAPPAPGTLLTRRPVIDPGRRRPNAPLYGRAPGSQPLFPG